MVTPTVKVERRFSQPLATRRQSNYCLGPTAWGLLLGAGHLVRADPLIELLVRQQTQLDRALSERGALLVCALGNLGRIVVSDVRIERGHQHQRVLKMAPDGIDIGLQAHYATVGEGATGVGAEGAVVARQRRARRVAAAD